MNHNDSSIYCVVKFMEFPFKGDYVCIPSSWVRVRRKSNTTVLVSYPDKHLKDIERRVRQRQELSGAWRLYNADMKYSTDSYEDAQNFVNGQFDDVQDEQRQPNVESKGDELSASESSNENQLTPPHADVSVENSYSQDIPVKKSQNDNQIEETTDLERSTNNTSSDIQNSSNLANQSLKPITIDKDNFCSNFTTFFSDMESYGDINQLITLFNENPEKAKKELKKVIDRRTRNSNIPTASTSKVTKAKVAKTSGKKRNNEKEQNDVDADGNGEDQVLKKKHIVNHPVVYPIRSSRGRLPARVLFDLHMRCAFASSTKRRYARGRNTASTSKDTKAKVAKTSGKIRNKEKEQNDDDVDDDDDDDYDVDDDDNGEDQVQTKKLCFNPKFDLPPEYDKKDTRWTLKYRMSAPGLVELMPNTDVYVNAEKLSNCKRLAKDCNTLARSLIIEIFKKSALSTCSWTGARAQVDTLGAHIRPGLDEDARIAMMDFVQDYGHKKGWETSDTQSILNSIRVKMQKMRPKHK